ncbi:MAG: addiction module protein [Verrucomicrobiales bacterium]|nr:addiction module protein [Verrucomicrobiales bacterium]
MTTDATTVDDLESAILDLPRNERSRIAKRILTSLEDDAETEISDAWNAEIGRRVGAMNDGVPGVSDEDASSRVRDAVAQVRNRKAS